MWHQLFDTDDVVEVDAAEWTNLSTMAGSLAAALSVDSLDSGTATGVTDPAVVDEHPFWENLEDTLETDAVDTFLLVRHARSPSTSQPASMVRFSAPSTTRVWW